MLDISSLLIEPTLNSSHHYHRINCCTGSTSPPSRLLYEIPQTPRRFHVNHHDDAGNVDACPQPRGRRNPSTTLPSRPLLQHLLPPPSVLNAAMVIITS